ncbi:hypothetical protein K440DRAFT_636242 [Wilcoxina mikolae CBS 423.85]|nr:hypothetical protein K440DRAFT_636242 [Wilcoxina mikolae CBS 423.85]
MRGDEKLRGDCKGLIESLVVDLTIGAVSNCGTWWSDQPHKAPANQNKCACMHLIATYHLLCLFYHRWLPHVPNLSTFSTQPTTTRQQKNFPSSPHQHYEWCFWVRKSFSSKYDGVYFAAKAEGKCSSTNRNSKISFQTYENLGKFDDSKFNCHPSSEASQIERSHSLPWQPGTSLATPEANPPVNPCVLENHPLALEWVSEVLPDLNKLMNRHFKAEETFKIEASPGSTPERLTVRISFRDPSKMQKVVGKSRCLDNQKYDVIYAQGDDLRVLASLRENLASHNDSLDIPNLPGCASGLPIHSVLDGMLLSRALMGGVVLINDESMGISAFHFLKQQPISVNTPIDTSPEASNDPNNVDSILPAEHTTAEVNHPSTPRPILAGDFGGIDVFLQPWPWSGSQEAETAGVGPPLKIQIHSASGSRLSALPFEWQGKSVGGLRCIMDWALFELPGSPSPQNHYFSNSETGLVKTIGLISTTTTVNPSGVRLVDIVVRGRVYCTGTTSALPCLLNSPGGSGLAFVVSTSLLLDEGLSGAWLVDSNTSELVGHLFAASMSSPLGYFVPIMETLRDIKTVLGTNEIDMAPDEPPESPIGFDPARLSQELQPPAEVSPRLPSNLTEHQPPVFEIPTDLRVSSDSPPSPPSRPGPTTQPNLGHGLILFLTMCFRFRWKGEQMIYIPDPLYRQVLLHRHRNNTRSESRPTATRTPRNAGNT